MTYRSEHIVDRNSTWNGAKGDPDWSRRDLTLSVDPEECVKCNCGTGSHTCWRLEVQKRA